MTAHEMRPRRPLGVTLAIVASIMLFSLLPLMQVCAILYVALRVSSTDASVNTQGEVLPMLTLGGDFFGVPIGTLIFQTVAALIFLMIAIFAWRGRPRGVRMIFLGAVTLLTVITFVSTVQSTAQPVDISAGIDSAGQVQAQLQWLRAFVLFLIPLYAVWYFNRAPARAFYRGYYLEQNNPTDQL
jgi:hypothetical protein